MPPRPSSHEAPTYTPLPAADKHVASVYVVFVAPSPTRAPEDTGIGANAHSPDSSSPLLFALDTAVLGTTLSTSSAHRRSAGACSDTTTQ